MRVLTVRQPWAWAIIHGGKNVENRVRNIAGDYRGPAAIHAGVREDTAARMHPEIIKLAADQWWTDPASLLTGRQDQFGHIIGVVDLVDVHDGKSESPHTRDGEIIGTSSCSGWADADAHHLVLANPRALDQPIPWKGALGLRKTNLEVIGDHLVERVDTCTCGQAGVSGPHEPACGYEPVARLVATS